MATQNNNTGLSVAEVKKQFEMVQPSLEAMNLNKLSLAQEMEFAIQAFEKNPYLLKTVGVANVLKNVVLSGLSLNPVLRYAYLVPRKISGTMMCCLDPGYIGLAKILTDTGSVVAISATIVYQKETGTYTDKDGKPQERFQIQTGANGWVKHTPYIGLDHPGKPVACYSIGVLPNGMQHVELLRPFEWENIKSRSESVKTYNTKKAEGGYAAIPSWLSDESEMIRKTCIKKHFKYLPKTDRAILAANAIDLDNQINGIEFESQHSAPAQPTPGAVEVALAVDEDLELFNKLIDHQLLKDKVFGGQKDKAQMRKYVNDLYNGAGVPKDKIEKWIKALTDEVAWYEAKVTEEETKTE